VQEVCNHVRIGVRRYDEGAVIKLRGEVYDELLIIGRGRLAAHIDDFSGKTLKVESLRAPEIVASAVFFAQENYLPVSISAEVPTTVFSLSRRSVEWIARHYEECLSALLTDMGNRLVFLAEKLRMAQFATIEQKLAAYLFELSHRHEGSEIKIPHTKIQLAEIFGVTRPALSRVFANLHEEGVIDYGTDWVEIRDMDKMEELLTDME
jgi:CRP-like cAMP-binding protein